MSKLETVIPTTVRWSEQLGREENVLPAVQKALDEGAIKIELSIDQGEMRPRFWFIHATRYADKNARKGSRRRFSVAP